MSSRYQKVFALPEGFPALLKNFTREILRDQPANIYEYGAHYFSHMLVEGPQPEEDDAPKSVADMSQAELEELVLNIFMEFDEDKNGYLDRREFKECLQSAQLGLSPQEIMHIMAEVDENDDGVVEYNEFMPLAVELLQSLQVKEDVTADAIDMREAARAQAEQYLDSMGRDALQEKLSQLFIKADADGNGWLSRAEFRAALVGANMGLTRKDINLMLSECDVNQDGAIEYKEFVPVALELLTQRLMMDLVSDAVWQSEDELIRALLEGFANLDTESTGHLSSNQIKEALLIMSYEWLGLSRLQVASIMALPEATPHQETNLVNYTLLVPAAAQLIEWTFGISFKTERAQTVATQARSREVLSMAHMDPSAIVAKLEDMFRAADTDQSGDIDYNEAIRILHELGALDMGLGAGQIAAIIGALDEDQDGVIVWEELVGFVSDLLNHLGAHLQSLTQDMDEMEDMADVGVEEEEEVDAGEAEAEAETEEADETEGEANE